MLILGDHLHDAAVGDGLGHAELHLKIGFLNDKVDERMEDFREHFDVVLLDDAPFDFVHDLVKDIVLDG